jgi:hypothetical protein
MGGRGQGREMDVAARLRLEAKGANFSGRVRNGSRLDDVEICFSTVRNGRD